MNYIENQKTDPYFNLALEEYVLKNRRDGDYLLLWRNSPVVVVGRHQNTLEEINREAVKLYGIQVVRRETGGGAVYHDLGNLNFSFITAADHAGNLDMDRFVIPVVRSLGRLGIQAQLTGRNDLTIGEKKISGNAQTVCRGRILHHGTLLFDADLERAQSVLTADEDKFRSRSTKSVRSRIGNLRDYLPQNISMDIEGLKAHLLREFGAKDDVLEPEEIRQIEELAQKKYRSPAWNYGESPEFEYENHIRFAGGTLKTGLRVEDGRITDIRFRGDFMAVRPVEEVEERLRGTWYERDCVREVLEGVDVEAYFGTVTAKEVVRCMF